MFDDVINESPVGDQPATTSDHNGRDATAHVNHLIAELQERTAELEAANRELRRVGHYRSLFLARMSHELRTPLTSILGFTEILLEQETLTESQRRFCKKIQDSGLQLQTSLDQLVDLSRIEAGQTEVFLQEISFRELLRDACAGVARLAHKQQVKIEFEVASDLQTIVSDEGRLRQILYSFLAWSVSRSQSAQMVSIHATRHQQSMLSVRIEDEGKGIESMTSVFDPEEKRGPLDLPNIDELGVIIGRKLIDILGGSVLLENRQPAGVITRIDVPVGRFKG